MAWYVLRVHIWYILSGKDWASNRLRHARGHDTNCEMLCLAGCEDADSCKYKEADSCKYKEAYPSKHKHKQALMQVQAHTYNADVVQFDQIQPRVNCGDLKWNSFKAFQAWMKLKIAPSVNDDRYSVSVRLVHTKLSPAIQKCISQSSIIEAIFIVSAPLLSPCLQEGFCRYKFAQRRWFASLTNKVHILSQGAYSLE